jgi:hypothetical protein
VRGSGRDYCAHESVIVRGPQRRCGRAVAWQRSGLASTISGRPWAQGRCCGLSRWSRVSFDGSGVVWLHACRGRPAASPVMLRRPIVSIKRIKETVELHRRYEF